MSTTTQPRFEAEIMFLDPYNASAAIAPLTGAGFDVEVIDWVDEGGTPYVWAIAMCKPGRDDGELWSEVRAIVKPLSGEVDRPGPATSQSRKSSRRTIGNSRPRRGGQAQAAAEVERKQAGIEYRIPAVQH